MRMPLHFSACTAVSRDEPTPFRSPETITSKLPSSSARVGNSRFPSTMRPAYASSARSSGPVAEAHPRRRHRVGVDVVEQVLDLQVLHAEVERARQLAADRLGVLRQEEDPLPRRQRDALRGRAGDDPWSRLRGHSPEYGAGAKPRQRFSGGRGGRPPQPGVGREPGDADGASEARSRSRAGVTKCASASSA